jgi:predicted esterase
MMQRVVSAALAGLTVLLTALPATAQDVADRYEVGLRLRAFERALDSQTDAMARKRILAPLKAAAPAFLASQLSEVARNLDRARLVLANESPADELLWAGSLRLRPGARLLDPGAGSLPFTCEEFYKSRVAVPAQARLRLTLTAGARTVAGPQNVDLKTLPLADQLSLQDLAEGDYRLEVEILAGERVLQTNSLGVSVVPKLKERLETLQKSLIDFEDRAKSTDLETVRRVIGLLDPLAARKTLETDYPAARLLADAESAIAALKAGKTYYGHNRPGQYWLTLVCARESKNVRLLAPAAAKKGDPLPLVIALHGTGGSDNLYFDANGHGLTAQLCEERGWLLVSPHGGPTDGIIDAVDKLYPVDRRRVFLLGHSLGAMHAVQIAADTPESFAAVAALSGAVSFKSSEKLRNLPFYVAAGTEDFGLNWARTLRDDLVAANVRKVVYKEYEGVEHLTVVQLSLPDIFTFFDRVAQR